MKTNVILNFGFPKKARFSHIPHNFSRGIQKSRSREPGTTSWGSYEKTYYNSGAGLKYIINFSSVKDFEKIWIFHEIKIDLRKILLSSNLGKLTKIFLNIKNSKKFW